MCPFWVLSTAIPSSLTMINEMILICRHNSHQDGKMITTRYRTGTLTDAHDKILDLGHTIPKCTGSQWADWRKKDWLFRGEYCLKLRFFCIDNCPLWPPTLWLVTSCIKNSIEHFAKSEPWLPLRLGWPVTPDIFHFSFASDPQVNEFRNLDSRRNKML